MTTLYECSCCGKKAHKVATKHKCLNPLSYESHRVGIKCVCEIGLGVDWYLPNGAK